jgi:lysozyme family protein
MPDTFGAETEVTPWHMVEAMKADEVLDDEASEESEDELCGRNGAERSGVCAEEDRR